MYICISIYTYHKATLPSFGVYVYTIRLHAALQDGPMSIATPYLDPPNVPLLRAFWSWYLGYLRG